MTLSKRMASEPTWRRRTRETSTYPASARADRCLPRTESELSRLSRMSENGNHRTGESIAQICRRKGAWISSSTPLRSPFPCPRCTTRIASLRGEQAGRNDHSHGPTKSPAHKSRIAVAGEQLGTDRAADKHRDRDERHFSETPPRFLHVRTDDCRLGQRSLLTPEPGSGSRVGESDQVRLRRWSSRTRSQESPYRILRRPMGGTSVSSVVQRTCSRTMARRCGA